MSLIAFRSRRCYVVSNFKYDDLSRIVYNWLQHNKNKYAVSQLIVHLEKYFNPVDQQQAEIVREVAYAAFEQSEIKSAIADRVLKKSYILSYS